MATAVTASDVRERWPFITVSFATDDVLTLLISEADDALGIGSTPLLLQRETAVKHYAAHLAVMQKQAANSQGMATGPVASASFLHRSEGRNITSSASGSTFPLAELESTVPGRQLILVLRATTDIPRLVQ